jgi:hypothetical protein
MQFTFALLALAALSSVSALPVLDGRGDETVNPAAITETTCHNNVG